MNYEDYHQNPEKYRLFKTAILNTNHFVENGGFDKGTLVKIEFFSHVKNPLFKRNEPLFWCPTMKTHVYGNGLTDFTL